MVTCFARRGAARKQTNKDRAAVELAKSAATLTLPSKMLPMLFLNNDKEAAVFASQRRLMVTWIKCIVVGQ